MSGCGPLTSTYDEALDFAATVHREQRRKGSDIPYLSHLMSVSALVLEDGGSETEAVAALLHDALEDGPAGTRERIAAGFGPEVLRIVEHCSDDEPAGGVKRLWSQRKTEYIARLLASDDLGAVRVTAADKLHNLRTTLTDLLLDPELLWPPSNACVHQNLWYYAAVDRAVREKLPTSRIALELGRTLDAVVTRVREPLPADTAAPPRCTVCPQVAA